MPKKLGITNFVITKLTIPIAIGKFLITNAGDFVMTYKNFKRVHKAEILLF